MIIKLGKDKKIVSDMFKQEIFGAGSGEGSKPSYMRVEMNK